MPSYFVGVVEDLRRTTISSARRDDARPVRAAEDGDVDLAADRPGPRPAPGRRAANAASRAGPRSAARATSVTPWLDPAVTGLTTTGCVQRYDGARRRGEQPRRRRGDADRLRRRAWSPTCPWPARRRATPEPTYGTPARSHSAARVPSSPRGPCSAGHDHGAGCAAHRPPPARPSGRSSRSRHVAVAVDGQRGRRRSRPGPARRRSPRRRPARRRARSSAAADHGDPGRVTGSQRAADAAVQPGAEAGDDLVLEGVGPVGPVGDGRLAVRRRGRRRSTASPSSRRVVAEVDDHHVHGDPADHRAPPAADQHLGAARGSRGQAVGVPERQQAEPGRRRRDPGVAVADAGAGRARCGRSTSGAVRVSAGRSVVVPRRVDADQAGADPAHGVVAERVGEGGGGGGEVPVGAAAARPAAARTPQANRARPVALVGVGRVVGAAAGGPSRRSRAPGPAARPGGPPGTGAAHCSGAAPSRAMPVSRWRCTRAPAPSAAIASRCSRLGTASSMSGRDRRAEVGVDRVEPAQRPARSDPRPRRADRLVDAGHPEPGRPGGEGRTRDVGGAVPEAVGLDHGHQLAGAPRRTAGCWRRPPRGRRSAAVLGATRRVERPQDAHAAALAADRAVESGGGAGDQRPVAVAVAPVPPLGRVVDESHAAQHPGEQVAVGARVGADPGSGEVAAAVALLGGRVDRGAEVELGAAASTRVRSTAAPATCGATSSGATKRLVSLARSSPETPGRAAHTSAEYAVIAAAGRRPCDGPRPRAARCPPAGRGGPSSGVRPGRRAPAPGWGDGAVEPHQRLAVVGDRDGGDPRVESRIVMPTTLGSASPPSPPPQVPS